MEFTDLLNDMTPEELNPRLELQILADPLHAISAATNNIECTKAGACNIKLS